MVKDLSRLVTIASADGYVESYELDHTEVVDSIEVGTYSVFDEPIA